MCREANSEGPDNGFVPRMAAAWIYPPFWPIMRSDQAWHVNSQSSKAVTTADHTLGINLIAMINQ